MSGDQQVDSIETAHGGCRATEQHRANQSDRGQDHAQSLGICGQKGRPHMMAGNLAPCPAAIFLAAVGAILLTAA